MILSGYVYIARAGDTFDLISLMIYRDEKYAPELMNANPTYCSTLVFSGGERLLIPSVDSAPKDRNSYSSETAPWRQ